MRTILIAVVVTLAVTPALAGGGKLNRGHTTMPPAQRCARVCAVGSILNAKTNMCEGGSQPGAPIMVGACPAATLKSGQTVPTTYYHSDIFPANTKTKTHHGRHQP